MSLEQEIASLRAAIVDLTEELRKHNGSKVAATPAVAESVPVNPKAETPVEVPPTSTPAAVAMVDVGRAAVALGRQPGGKEKLAAIFSAFGATKLPDIKEEQLSTVLSKILDATEAA